jgi:hypothetical protein
MRSIDYRSGSFREDGATGMPLDIEAFSGESALMCRCVANGPARCGEW